MSLRANLSNATTLQHPLTKQSGLEDSSDIGRRSDPTKNVKWPRGKKESISSSFIGDLGKCFDIEKFTYKGRLRDVQLS